jgi:predicted acetyltransferase
LPGLRRVHQACARPGFLARDDAFWALRLHDPVHRRKGAAPLRCLVAGDPADPDGYALHSLAGEWAPNGPNGTLHVREVLARSPGAHAALWTWLTTTDLTSTVCAEHLPVDDALLTLLANPRSVGATWGDGLHVRLVDLPAALCARGWAAPVDVVLEVADRSCRWNAGRWRLTAGPDGATCARTAADPDLSCDVADLGAVHLGGTSLQQLAAAGRVSEWTPGAVRSLSVAARGEVAPWSPMVF